MALTKNRLYMLGRYLLSAGSGLAFNFVVFFIMKNVLDIGYLTSYGVGYCSGMIIGFLMTKYFAFEVREQTHVYREAIKYVSVSLMSLFISGLASQFVLYVYSLIFEAKQDDLTWAMNVLDFLNAYGINRYLLAWASGVAVSFILNLVAHKKITFRTTGTYNFIQEKRAAMRNR